VGSQRDAYSGSVLIWVAAFILSICNVQAGAVRRDKPNPAFLGTRYHAAKGLNLRLLQSVYELHITTYHKVKFFQVFPFEELFFSNWDSRHDWFTFLRRNQVFTVNFVPLLPEHDKNAIQRERQIGGVYDIKLDIKTKRASFAHPRNSFPVFNIQPLPQGGLLQLDALFCRFGTLLRGLCCQCGSLRRLSRFFRLTVNILQGQPSNEDADKTDSYQRPIRDESVGETVTQRLARLATGTVLLWGGFWLGWNRSGRWDGWGWKLLALLCCGLGFELLFLDYVPDGKHQRGNHKCLHSSTIVLQKYLDKLYSCSTVIDMANVLSKDKQIAVVSALVEGSSIRSIERMTGINRNTIMNLGVRVGKGCTALLDAKMRDLPCRYLQFDEVWGFSGKKERHCSVDDNPEYGDVWTFCAIDAETKLVPSFKCGKRNLATAKVFVEDVASRMRTRVQISSDALRAYVDAIEDVYGADVDYGQIVKTYEHDDAQNAERKYSAARFVSVDKRPVTGSPDMDLVSTSYIERLNATTRLHMRRLTRLTLAFSKKFESFEAAVGLHFAYYNLVKRHGSLRMTPAMAAGVERDFWSVGDLVEAAA